MFKQLLYLSSTNNKFKYVFIFISFLILLVAGSIYVDHKNNLHDLETRTYDKMKTTVSEYAMIINYNVLQPIQTLTNAMMASFLSRVNRAELDNAKYIQHGYEPNNFVFAMELLRTIPHANGLSVWLSPDIFDTSISEAMKLYVSRRFGGIVRRLDIYDLSVYEEDWFQIPFSTQTSLWTNPFIWENQQIFTYSIPIIINQKPVGVVATDVLMSIFDPYLNNIDISIETGYIYLLDSNFNSIYHPTAKDTIGQNFFDILPNIESEKYNMLTYNTGVISYDYNGRKLAAWIKLTNGYYLVFAANLDVILHNVKIETYKSIFFGLLFLFISAFVVYIYFLSINRPLLLVEKTITKSNMNRNVDIKVEVKYNREAGKVSYAINDLYTTLHNVISSNKNISLKQKDMLFRNITQELSAHLQEILASIIQMTDSANFITSAIKEMFSNIQKHTIQINAFEKYLELIKTANQKIQSISYNWDSNLDQLITQKEIQQNNLDDIDNNIQLVYNDMKQYESYMCLLNLYISDIEMFALKLIQKETLDLPRIQNIQREIGIIKIDLEKFKTNIKSKQTDIKEDIQKHMTDIDKEQNLIKNLKTDSNVIETHFTDIVSSNNNALIINQKQLQNMTHVITEMEQLEDSCLLVNELINNIQQAIDGVVKNIEKLATEAYLLDQQE